MCMYSSFNRIGYIYNTHIYYILLYIYIDMYYIYEKYL